MNFDARDIIEVNRLLLEEAKAKDEPRPAILIAMATWGRGADPAILSAVQPFRVGLGFNGSVVARLPRELGAKILPPTVIDEIRLGPPQKVPVCGAVAKDWRVEFWPLEL